MRKSTKIASFLLILVMLLSTVVFASCEKPNIKANDDQTSETPDKPAEENMGGASYGAGGLLFMPLEDGTYGVTVGNAKYQSNITIPETFNGKAVTSIFEGAFSGASNLKMLSIPNSITYVGDGAFEGCENLEYYEDKNAYYLGNSKNNYLILVEAKDPTLTSCTLTDETVAICDRAFEGCENLVTISTTKIKSIGSYAFSGCSSLREVTIPQSATSIGKEMFLDCSSLKTINIPSSVSVIGESAFSGCTNLQTVTFAANSKLTKINNGAFYNCASLTKIIIPKNVLYIGDQKVNTSTVTTSFGAFEGCSLLGEVKFEGSNVKMIGTRAFKGCSKLTAISLPDSISELGSSAFESSGLTSIKIPSELAKIKSSTFLNCKALKTVTLSSSVTAIFDKAFSNTAVTTIVIPEKVNYIGESTFFDCKSLTSITMRSTTGWVAIDKKGKETAITSTDFGKADTAAKYFTEEYYNHAFQKK